MSRWNWRWREAQININAYAKGGKVQESLATHDRNLVISPP
jgi:hypothetical protein